MLVVMWQETQIPEVGEFSRTRRLPDKSELSIVPLYGPARRSTSHIALAAEVRLPHSHRTRRRYMGANHRELRHMSLVTNSLSMPLPPKSCGAGR